MSRPMIEYLAEVLPSGRCRLSIIGSFATFDSLEEATAYVEGAVAREAERTGQTERPFVVRRARWDGAE